MLFRSGLLGRRVIVRPCMRPNGFDSMESFWMASDFDDAFAQYVTVPASEVFPVACDWSDAELGALPCAYGTAENMIHRAEVGPGDRVLVSGASGGTGSASVQLARRRGAQVVAMASAAKTDAVSLSAPTRRSSEERYLPLSRPTWSSTMLQGQASEIGRAHV